MIKPKTLTIYKVISTSQKSKTTVRTEDLEGVPYCILYARTKFFLHMHEQDTVTCYQSSTDSYRQWIL